ncbi:MAG: energy transducer TonB, partial [Bdellovibrionales bacterium]|nr:energy transducer TonB [Bdellovibrionales bacterium]
KKSIPKNNIKDSSMKEESQDFAQSQKMALTYKEELNIYLSQNKRYPRRALKLRQSGVVQLQVLITPSGEFRRVRVVTPSGFETLDQAATKLLNRLARFKPLPNGYKGTGEFIVPISYELKGTQRL